MLSTSETRRELLLANPRISSTQNHKNGNVYGLRRHRNKLIYQKRKAVSLCIYGRCTARADAAHAQCQNHLRLMAKRARERLAQRKAQGLCTYCGERPQFWGRKCIRCRQVSAANPLPFGARRALRLYREAEARVVREQKQKEAARLLAT